MEFHPLPLEGAFLIKPSPYYDKRGSFIRHFCHDLFKEKGLITNWVQTSTCHNLKRGEKRGMHLQNNPFSETKLVSCIKGSLIDVIIDCRPTSVTYQKHYRVQLSADNAYQLYIPKNFAHGYTTLEDDTILLYMMDEFYHPEAAQELPFPTCNVS